MTERMGVKIMTMIMKRTIKRIAKIKKKRRRLKEMRRIIATIISKMRIII
jgi:hypothetical protein